MITAYITKAETGETRKYDITSQGEVFEFCWSRATGNFGCDCNRALFFARAIGEEDKGERPCGEKAYRVRIEEDGAVVFEDRL